MSQILWVKGYLFHIYVSRIASQNVSHTISEILNYNNTQNGESLHIMSMIDTHLPVRNVLTCIFCGMCCLKKKDVISYPKNHLCCKKKGEPKKMQVTERLQVMKSL